MRLFLLLLLGLGLGVGVGVFAALDRGYMVMVWNDWQVVFPNLVLVLLVAGVVFFGVHYLLLFARQVPRWQRDMRHWRKNRRADRARVALTKGLVALAEGRWRQGEKQLLRHVAHSETPLIHYLGAARGAGGRGLLERRDHYLMLAQQTEPDAAVAIHYSQADSHLRQGQWEQALATLRELQKMAPSNSQVLDKLAQVYWQLQDWQGLYGLLPQIKKSSDLDAGQVERMEKRCLLELINRTGTEDTLGLDQLWKTVPKALRVQPELVAARTTKLQAQGRQREAISFLQRSLDECWDQGLVRLYGSLEAENAEAQLKYAETWVRNHPDDPVLSLVLGRICERLALWGKARGYYGASVTQGGGSAARHALGELLLRLDEPGAALEQFRSGLAAAVLTQTNGVRSPESIANTLLPSG